MATTNAVTDAQLAATRSALCKRTLEMRTVMFEWRDSLNVRDIEEVADFHDACAAVTADALALQDKIDACDELISARIAVWDLKLRIAQLEGDAEGRAAALQGLADLGDLPF